MDEYSNHNKSVENDEYFFYKIGKTETFTQWGKPSYEKIKNLFIELKNKTEIFKDYEVYLYGGVLFNLEKTKDVDVFINGEIKDYKIFENYLNLMYDLALNKYNIFFDIFWFDRKFFEIIYDEIMQPNFNYPIIKAICLTNVIKQEGNKKIISSLSGKEGVENITEDLVQFNFIPYKGRLPENKHFLSYGNERKERIIKLFKDNPNLNLKNFFNVKELLNNDKQYFINNTNNWLNQ